MTRHPEIVMLLGDQLSETNPALAAADPSRDRVLMVETRAEARHVPSHKQRIAMFLAAMRHRAECLREAGWTVDYLDLDQGCPSLADGLRDGTIALDRPGLADHLRATVVSQLAIDQPRYPGLAEALATSR